jgi:hypothetical protein
MLKQLHVLRAIVLDTFDDCKKTINQFKKCIMNTSGNKQYGKCHNIDNIPVSQNKFKSSLLEAVTSNIDRGEYQKFILS